MPKEKSATLFATAFLALFKEWHGGPPNARLDRAFGAARSVKTMEATQPRAAPTGTPTDEAEVPHDIGSGYVIERKLGIGSYATVWLARTTASETA